MSSDHEISLHQNRLNAHQHQHQLMFRVQDDALRLPPPQTTQQQQHRRVGVGDPKPTPPNFADRYFAAAPSSTSAAAEFRRNLVPPHWNSNSGPAAATPPSGGDESEGDDEDDDDVDDDEEDDDEVDDDDHDNRVDGGAIKSNNINNDNINTITTTTNNTNNSGGGGERVHSGGGGAIEKMGNGNGKAKLHSTYVKDGNLTQGGVSENHSRMGNNLNYGNNAVTVAEQQPDGDMYYSQYLQAAAAAAAVAEGSNGGGDSGQKDLVAENGCGFSGRKDASSFSTESGESLRAILSDPITGALMDDARILPCGHSFGGGGLQHVIRMKACCTCSQPVSEDSIAPNLSLRIAVQAFRREDESQFYRSSKRRRERFDQDKGSYGDPTVMDPPRGRGVQFPFAVTDRVIIKGNKRTPQRFVGREAVVTTQCLNGWYVVKTLDNAESVKLQYRSLAKVSDDPSKPMSSEMAPNWLQ